MDTMQSQLLDEQWHLVPDVRDFFRYFYLYYYHHGWTSIVCWHGLACVRVVGLNVALFTLLHLVDWRAIAACDDEPVAVFRLAPLTTASSLASLLPLLGWVAWSVTRLCGELRRFAEVRALYHALDVPDRKLRLMAWEDVLAALRHHNEHHHRLLVHAVDDATVAAVVTRDDNMLLALVASEVLPAWQVSGLLVHILRVLVFDRLDADERGTRRLLRLTGGLLLVAAPLVVLHRATNALVQHIQALYDRKVPDLFEGDFTCAARARYRRCNELPHEAELRFACARVHARAYIDHFPVVELVVARQLLHFVASLGLALVVLITTVNEEAVVQGRLRGLPSLVVVALLALTVRATNSPPRTLCDRAELQRVVLALGDALCGEPHAWSSVALDTVDDIRHIYRSHAFNLAVELASSLLVPLLLLAHLPFERILRCLRAHSRNVHGAGWLCEYGLGSSSIDDALVDAYLRSSAPCEQCPS